jgi:hypothetical protein
MNNWTQDTVKWLLALHTTYIAWEKEVGKEKTPHLQGFAVLKNAMSEQALKKLFKSGHGWAEHMRGSIQKNIDYCDKENGLEEYGKRPMTPAQQGQASKDWWKKTLSRCRKGQLQEIEDDNTEFYFSKIKLIEYHADKVTVKPKRLRGRRDSHNQWIWGPTGTGKTIGAALDWPGHYKKDANNKWWCGYDPKIHSVVIIDDLHEDDARKYMGKYLKMWVQNEPFSAERKNLPPIIIRPKKVIVTCQWSPAMIWNRDEDHNMLDPIQERFTIIFKDGSELPSLLRRLKDTEYREDYDEVMNQLKELNK